MNIQIVNGNVGIIAPPQLQTNSLIYPIPNYPYTFTTSIPFSTTSISDSYIIESSEGVETRFAIIFSIASLIMVLITLVIFLKYWWRSRHMYLLDEEEIEN